MAMSATRWVWFFRHPSLRGIGIGLACALLTWFASRNDMLRGLEDWQLDGCFWRRGNRPTQANIVIIGIDEPSMRRLGKPLAFASPELALVVNYLKQEGATAIGLDVYVPDSYSRLPQINDAKASGEGRLLGDAVVAAGNVILPEWWTDNGWLPPLRQWRASNREGADLAFLNQTEDDDHFVRRVRLLQEGRVPQFGLAVFARSQGAAIHWDETTKQLTVGGEAVPLDENKALRINYVGPPGTIPTIPFRDVLEAAAASQSMPQLRGAIVLVGVTAWTDIDENAVPFNNNYARFLPTEAPPLMGATEVHANIISTLSDRAFIHTPRWLDPFPLLLLFGALLGAAYARLTPVWGLGLLLAHHVGWKLLALSAFAMANWRLEMISMLMLGGMVYALSYAARWRKLRQTLGIVKSESVAHALEQDPRRLDLGGKDSVITVLFSDMRSFSTFAETRPAQEVVALLNAYYSAIVPEIEAEGGTVCTYMGDGIMVLFGAPVEHADHAHRALQAAMAMVRRVRALASTWAELGCDNFQIGIGIHTGKAVVGSVGSPQRLDYTAIGDTVNAAARIEAETKSFESEILISAATFDALPEAERAWIGREARPTTVMVKGKQEELSLYPVEVKDRPAPIP